ncbi:SDR family NAD(P)-dependent oxidoreductase (plasmid) [Bacillus cereus]|uniref:SDR family NAD(P)-dependent oxidoreductase n=1 Tax=Bacillus cereus TaxID=1396 RepID=UPI00155F97FC|nr:SDR family NAD(P)-dependent oxidoreductase [Bacillus cereus]QKH04690.1 SDR family NAD(P)-dependent oxidoreductase [Bacillus cereus]QKH10743.1 SDR family NAD(P)-dependent oxidoreductase [Bacillus cereus]
MNNNKLSRKAILRLIETKKISSEEGLLLLRQQMTSETTQTEIFEGSTVLKYYRSDWKQANSFQSSLKVPKEVVLLLDRDEELFVNLQKLGCRPVLVKLGTSFRKIATRVFEINPAVSEDYLKLMEYLKMHNLLPGRIIHRWSRENFIEEEKSVQAQLAHGIYSVLFIVQSLMKQKHKQVSFMYLYQSNEGEGQPQNQAISGTAKSIRKENPGYIIKTVGVTSNTSIESLTDIVLHESSEDTSKDIDVLYKREGRFLKQLDEVTVNHTPGQTLSIKKDGAYLITGGLGGLGLQFANYFARKAEAKLILTGRSKLNETMQKKIKMLEENGSQILYVQADISKRAEVERLVKTAQEKFGTINGIIHCAGVLRDSFVLNKTKIEMEEVLAPKVFGTMHLFNAINKLNVDFVVLFSSLVAEIGNGGQSDYAFGNAFMDNYAELMAKRHVNSKIVSINWPLWLEGGMDVTEEAIELMKRTYGIVPLTTANGLKAFEDGLMSSHHQLLVLEEIREKKGDSQVAGIEDQNTLATSGVKTDEKKEIVVDEMLLRSKTERFLKELLSKEIKLSKNEIDSNEEFENYGLDSVMILALIKSLENNFGELSKTLFFEYQSIADLANYFIENHHNKLLSVTGLLPTVQYVKQQNKKMTDAKAEPQQVIATESRSTDPVIEISPRTVVTSSDSADIVIEELQLINKTERLLKEVLSKKIKLSINEIDSHEALENYGLDSVMVMALIKDLEEIFGELSKTLLFEYQNIADLAGYFIENHRSKLLENEKIVSKIKAKTNTEALQQTQKNSSSVFNDMATSRFLDNSEQKILEKEGVTHEEWPESKQTKQDVKTSHMNSYENDDDVAIIGVSGRYPQAHNLDELWENLKKGQDCVTEIPEDRWDYRELYSPEKGTPGKIYSKWGGFLDEIDKFDPLFFNIAPIEAQLIDPQERLFLETVWHALEDAGYSRKQLAKRMVGVFVGIMYGHYQMFGAEESQRGNVIAASSSFASVANRVSYIFDFHGPSIALDTMCSSSLTSIHLACDSILKGESEIAVAGGVNLTLHPNKYTLLSQSKFLASDGRCHTFGTDGDGYVPGEGVGAVILKPLKKAISDGDQIYAVIKSTAINHGGKTNGYFVPNPNAQANVIAEALRKANIDPRTISYIEAHGTGTSLGDPIEITGLTKAFNEYTKEKQFCSIGSAKSNLGHLESAAGIAGITKLILQLKHKELVPSIHSSTLNPNINFTNTPFYVQHELMEWKRPIIIENGEEKIYPRRAGISAFGAGGTNCHIILEEYEDDRDIIGQTSDREPQVVVLSAKDQEQLEKMAKNLLAYLEKNTDVNPIDNQVSPLSQMRNWQVEVIRILTDIVKISTDEIDLSEAMTEYGIDLLGFQTIANQLNKLFSLNLTALELSTYPSLAALIADVGKTIGEDAVSQQGSNYSESNVSTNSVSLRDLAYTLQVGREGMEERVAFVSGNLQELYKQLRSFCVGKVHEEKIYKGNIKASKKTVGQLVSGKTGEEFLKIVMREKDLDKLAQFWVSGLEINWALLHENKDVRRISVPVYPFARERYWIPMNLTRANTEKKASVFADRLHPLVHSNISDLQSQKYKIQPDYNAFYLKDITIREKHVFPNTAAIEMVRAAGELAAGKKVKMIQRMVFASPVVLESENSEMRVDLYPIDEDVDFEWSYVDENGKKNIASQGRIVYQGNTNLPSDVIKIQTIKNRLSTKLNTSECYARLMRQGFQYGTGYSVLREFFMSSNEALAYIEVPDSLRDSTEEYVIHPVLLEGALQTTVLLAQEMGEKDYQPLLLKQMDEMIVSCPPSTACYVHVMKSEADGFNICLLDENGRMLMKMENVVLAPVELIGDEANAMNKDSLTSHLLEKRWRESTVGTDLGKRMTGQVIVLSHIENIKIAEKLFANHPGINKLIITDDKEKSQKHNANYMFDFANYEQGKQTIEKIVEEHDAIVGLVDLSDVRDEAVNSASIMMGKIALLQGLIKNLQVDAFPLIHLTKGLQTFGGTEATLAGANIAGLIKMLGAEYSKMLAVTVDVDLVNTDLEMFCYIVESELVMGGADNEVIYRNGKRFVPYLQEVYPSTNSEFTLIHPERVIVISGGTRGIGAEVAKYLVGKGAKKLVLMGVQPCPQRKEWKTVLLDPNSDKKIVERIKLVQWLEQQGAKVEIYSGSLLNKEELQAYFTRLRLKWGEIGGVVHCAGLASMETPAFINKNSDEIERVFEPKIKGLETLHEIFNKDDLAFFVLFSSVSAVTPQLAVGVSDYAMANAFMDAFARFQNAKGRTYYKSINWTNWRGGGMGEVTSDAYTQLGLTTHSVQEGLELFNEAMRLKSTSVVPCIVNNEQFEQAFMLKSKLDKKARTKGQITSETKRETAPSNTEMLKKLKNLFSVELRIPEAKLDEDTQFGDFGVDSILIAELVKKIEEMVGGKLDPSILLEHPTLSELAKYLVSNFIDSSLQSETFKVKKDSETASKISPASRQRLTFREKHKKELKPYLNRPTRNNTTKEKMVAQNEVLKIAVIGAACHFPGATTKEEYWNNLKNGVNSVVEVPKSRFDINKYYEPEYKQGKSISRWGGFIDGIEKFDPAYFNFSENDAPQIDPLIRQFLEVSVETVRDSGYEEKELWGKKVGVFVGSRVGDYASRIKQAVKNSIIGVGQNFISAHTSHFLNLKGPSVVVDTACSSSLVSIHLACQSLMTGESEMAIAGGVDILLNENPYIVLSEGRALSLNGKCRTFDQNANGFVPGEGCGAVMLKMLDKAIEDGDQIYAVIDATAVNNDGRTMGITTPNLEAQKEVIRDAQQKAGISPSSISYIEAHGTGTMIGDPIELKALTKVFRQETDEIGFCGVGSVKSNFGHLLSAAGIASFIKVVLAIKNKQLPPTLNCETPNPRFKFDTSPFYPNTSLQNWEKREGTRRAGISSFGFGGTNAHIILNECDTRLFQHVPRIRRPLPPVTFNRKRYWIVEEEQKAVVDKMLQYPKMMELIDETL